VFWEEIVPAINKNQTERIMPNSNAIDFGKALQLHQRKRKPSMTIVKKRQEMDKFKLAI
jgi:hypothetical protein